MLNDPLVRGYGSTVTLRARAFGDAIRIPTEQTPAQRHVVTRKIGAFKTSMLQDVEAGRPLEISSLVGAVCELGQHLGLVTPNMDAQLGLVWLMAQQRDLHPVAE
jgi:2-dehydropantoate 2-reductase